MVYRGIKYLVRAKRGPNEWALYIYYPDRPRGSQCPTIQGRERKQAQQRGQKTIIG